MINCLAHADYVQAYPSIKIEVFEGWFHFLNPGEMLVSLQQFRTGGDSRPRNEIIMKMFRWLGASERQGYGGPLIYTTTLKSDIPISVSKMREEADLSDYKVRKWLNILDEKKLVQRIGSGPATKYTTRETADEKITQLQIALDNLKTKE